MIKLTKKTAREILSRCFSAGKEVRKIDTPPDVQIYAGRIGAFEVRVENDWFLRNGLYSLRLIGALGGNAFRMYIAPETLERDYDAEGAANAQ